MGRLDGKVAVVTGAGSGIGACERDPVRAGGAKVVCADRSGQEAETARTIGDAAIGVKVDVSVAADVERMVDTAESTFGPLDVLFNNAGFGGPMAPLAEQSEETWDAVHAVNLKGFTDEGVSIHVWGTDDGHEYLRFDVFADDPHSHYNHRHSGHHLGNGDDIVNNVIDFDAVALGDILTWVLECLRTRLGPMLVEAGGAHLVDALDVATIDAVLDDVRSLAEQAKGAG